MNVSIKLLENGKTPTFAHESDACCDCYACVKEPIVIKAKTRTVVPLGFCLQLPKQYEAVIRPRSGLSKKGIDVCVGTIDEGYVGEVKANVCNNSDNDFEVSNGDRICQMAIRYAPIISFEEVNELVETERGSNGFGSTGV